jgi:hypothetical protein
MKWWRDTCFQDNLVYRLEGIEAPKTYSIRKNSFLVKNLSINQKGVFCETDITRYTCGSKKLIAISRKKIPPFIKIKRV